MLRVRKVAVTIAATNANPISSLDNYIAPSAFIFCLIAKHTCDCVTCGDYSQRFVNRGYVDNGLVDGDAITFAFDYHIFCEMQN